MAAAPLGTPRCRQSGKQAAGFRHQRLAEDGTFEIRCAPPGRWRVELWSTEKIAGDEIVEAGATNVVIHMPEEAGR